MKSVKPRKFEKYFKASKYLAKPKKKKNWPNFIKNYFKLESHFAEENFSLEEF